eukprot:Nitzschia sp. Nitz4//scaffold1_size375055//165021//165248//NITZ4_000266-RA/size375055-exonerate_protein2genome-gene-0.20-mRNA-1//1//CDS//3329541015//5937//frame0
MDRLSKHITLGGSIALNPRTNLTVPEIGVVPSPFKWERDKLLEDGTSLLPICMWGKDAISYCHPTLAMECEGLER